MTEKLRRFPDILNMLSEHEIGYHSSSHSVHPTIFEFTDVENYEEAYQVSILRETSRINPLTGKIEGEGGIYALQRLFPRKQIISFRAPGHCWVPPHLEALKRLGIKFDFSADLSLTPVNFKGITFYPYPVMGNWEANLKSYRILWIAILKRRLSIISFHPSLLVNKIEWDSIYREGNPTKLVPPPARDQRETSFIFNMLDRFLLHISNLQKIGLIEVTPNLEESKQRLCPTEKIVEKCYKRSIKWALKRNYKPKFIFNHFLKFFELEEDP